MAKVQPQKSTASGITLSDEIENQQEIFIVLGNIGAGKTFFSASASNYMPKSLPAKKRTVLEDMLWMGFDAGAAAGFKHNKLSVPYLDIVQIMSDPDIYEHHGFTTRPPTITEALNIMHNLADDYIAEGKTHFLVVDTITTLDVMLLDHHRKVCKGDTNTYAKYDLNLAAHSEHHNRNKATGINVIYNCHSRAVGESPSQKDKNVSVLVVGGSRFIPDITGRAPAIYKRDASAQIVIAATKRPKVPGLSRKVYIGYNDIGWEGKNRYEGLLPDEMEPNLGKILEIIKKG